jgi:hypothetical protein
MLRTGTLILVFAAISGLMQAQAIGPLEIGGIVIESGGAATLPVSGAQVTLSAPGVPGVIATTYTDSTGAFAFQPPRPGDYIVDFKKDGYFPQLAPDLQVTVSPGHSATRLSFYFTRRGQITGRVIDEDGQPVADLGVTELRWPDSGTTPTTVITGEDGTFTATDLTPGNYVVRVSSRAGFLEKVVPQYSDDDLKTVDEDLETSYWPGGFPEPSATVQVRGGASADAGTIKVRKAPYYRAHVSAAPVECTPGEMWTLSILESSSTPLGDSHRFSSEVPCAKDFLIRNLRPGSYWFMIRKDEPDPGRWALASADILTKNLEVALNMEPEAEIIGRVIAADGATLPPLDSIGISTKPATVGFAGGASLATPDAEGKFVLTGLKFPRHQIVVTGLTRQYYVKEIRFNGAPSDGFVTLGPGSAQLEIVIDDKPGAIAGTVTDGDQPATQALVMLFKPSLQPAQFPTFTDKEGRFQFTGLVPGEYRALAVPLRASRPEDLDAATRLAARAETITVERGATRNIDLHLTDPSR